MEYTINIQDLFQQAFGLRRPIYVVQAEPTTIAQATNNYNQPLQTVFQLPAEGSIKSTLGTVVLNPVLFESGSYKQRLGDGRIVTVDYSELLLPPATLVEVNLKKVVVKTPLVSGQGTFKENVSFDDYEVRIRSVFTGESIDEVEDFMRRIMELWTIPKEIKVVCDYLNLLDIDALVIESITPQQLEGRPLMLPVEISCVSDKPLQLNLGN